MTTFTEARLTLNVIIRMASTTAKAIATDMVARPAVHARQRLRYVSDRHGLGRVPLTYGSKVSDPMPQVLVRRNTVVAV
jgi:hypothetical protein